MAIVRHWWAVLGVIMLLAIAVWWYFPREKPQLWYVGTAPNPEGRRAEQPEPSSLPLDQEFLDDAELSIDGKPVDGEQFALRSGNTVKISGELQLKNVASNLRLIDVAVALFNRADNPQGMISEGHSSLSFKKKRTSTTTETVMFDQDWLVPAHLGKHALAIEFHLFKPGQRTAPRRFAMSRAIVVE